MPAFAAAASAVRTRLARPGAGLLLGLAALTACQAGPGGASGQPSPGVPARWVPFRHAGVVTDLAQARPGGRLMVAANGTLSVLGAAGSLTPFARGRGGYATLPAPESYLALVPGGQVPGAGCSFAPGTVFALRPRSGPGVFEVTSGGRARRYASLPGTFPNGIAYDSGGRFGHRLLVTSYLKGARWATLFSLDCRGHVTTVSSRLPRLEGGLSIAPPSFGAYGGDLIATDELADRIYAITPAGRATLIARGGLPAGQDVGVESTGFVPPGFGAGWAAYLADRLTPRNPHPGTGNILRLPGAGLLRAGARPGDLLVAGEGGALTIRVRCGSAGCSVRRIAEGPAVAHAEGRIVFARLG